MNAKTVGVALAALIMAALLVGQIVGGRDDTEPDTTAPAPTGTATLAPEPPATAPTSSVPSVNPADQISDETRAAQFEAASAYTVAYFSYSYRDKTPNDFIARVKPYATKDHYDDLTEHFADDDGSMSNAWDDVRKERTVVTTSVSDTAYDPWYDPTATTAVVAVTYTRSTENTVGTGGVGDPQTFRVKVVKSGDTFLVSDTIAGDSSAG